MNARLSRSFVVGNSTNAGRRFWLSRTGVSPELTSGRCIVACHERANTVTRSSSSDRDVAPERVQTRHSDRQLPVDPRIKQRADCIVFTGWQHDRVERSSSDGAIEHVGNLGNIVFFNDAEYSAAAIAALALARAVLKDEATRLTTLNQFRVPSIESAPYG
jgi:hypothetical protein